MKGRRALTICLAATTTIGCACSAFAVEDCIAPDGLAAITSSPNATYVLFGETHGSSEAPAFFADAVCAVAVSGKSVLVGLELPEEASVSLQQFMNSAGTPDDIRTFLSGSLWEQQARQFPDGRTSEAMLALVQQLRAMHQSGYEVAVSAFVPSGLEPGDPYEAGMATMLMEAQTSGPYDLVMVLVGNVHAYGAQLNFGTPYRPMAMHLPRNNTLTLRMVSRGGTSWNCQSDGCGIHSLRASTTDDAVGIRIGADLAPGYDGIFHIGQASASAPAIDLP